MYKIKQLPEDFIVDEVLTESANQQLLESKFQTIKSNDSQTYKYIIYKLTKKQLNTIQVIDMLTKKLSLRQQDVGFAGIKDKVGITSQYISLPNIERAQNIESPHENITLEDVGHLPMPITTKILAGNNFIIKVKNVQDYTIKEQDWICNYFGEQRFSKNNVNVGRFLIQQKFKEAVEEMLEYAKENPTYNERKILQYLEKKPTDFVGAMRTLPPRTLTLYIHAYQSYLFNKILSHYVEGEEDTALWATIPTQTEKPEIPEKIPALGFYYKPEEYDEQTQQIIKQIMDEEQITPRSFIIRSMQEITEPGAVRDSIAELGNLKVKDEGDTKTLSFFLPKGSYATVALRHLLCKQHV